MSKLNVSYPNWQKLWASLKVAPLTGLLLVSAMQVSTKVQASIVAVIDSGADMKHKDLEPQTWLNSLDLEEDENDDDENGYKDDLYGWNFAENNNRIIEYKYLNLHNKDVERFFDIQSKSLQGRASTEETEWLKVKLEDEKFRKRLGTYGNFMHGTHVTGIAAKDAPAAKFLTVKLIPTEVGLPGSNLDNNETPGLPNLGMAFFKMALEMLAQQQGKAFVTIAEYIRFHKADVANGSFGTGYKQAEGLLKEIFKATFRRDATETELKEVTDHFLNAMIRNAKKMADAAPDTLYVFAAGNDGSNNDVYPSSPTNIDADNVISVAATWNDRALAPFSNYGVLTVDVAAPGVAIKSTVPGSLYLSVSGTSQAAPFVSNIAAKVKDANPKLKAWEIKHVIMGTVDKRSYLEGKVKTGGIVNGERAVVAAKLAQELGVARAIDRAHNEVRDNGADDKDFAMPMMMDGMVLPLPSDFQMPKSF